MCIVYKEFVCAVVCVYVLSAEGEEKIVLTNLLVS